MPKTKVYTMEVTVSVTLPDDYEESIDEYGESECEDACCCAVTQQFQQLGHNSPSVNGADAKWLRVWTECGKPKLEETTDAG